MQQVRYECALVEQVLAKEYAATMEDYLKRMRGLNDIKPFIGEFEKDFANYIGVRHAIAVNSGSDALQMILKALGIKKGDEVIIPDLTYQAVALAVVYCGARPVLVDVRKTDLTMDVAAVKRVLTKKTKAIVAAHMFGRACDLVELQSLCRRQGIKLVEDVCQAESSCLNGKMLGSFGDFSAFSFSYYKPLSSCGGGGGMILFNDSKYACMAGWMDNWRDDPELLTVGQRFSPLYFMDLVALRVKFKHLAKIIESRKRIKALYEQELMKVPGLRIFQDRAGTDSVPQNFVVLCDARDNFFKFLSVHGIMAQKPYIPLHAMDAYQRFSKGRFLVSREYLATALHLPLYSFMGEDKARHVIDICRKFFLKQRVVMSLKR
ncbi:MAG: DegT/DnrJ/EryC1/StrS family aminotransferase [Candidatus Omnitrophica bacterium]|nr:DegT/DnrJ/EryC1/StrS family aminotransferase [Candidatus Omnitrophota bacterium]